MLVALSAACVGEPLHRLGCGDSYAGGLWIYCQRKFRFKRIYKRNLMYVTEPQNSEMQVNLRSLPKYSETNNCTLLHRRVSYAILKSGSQGYRIFGRYRWLAKIIWYCEGYTDPVINLPNWVTLISSILFDIKELKSGWKHQYLSTPIANKRDILEQSSKLSKNGKYFKLPYRACYCWQTLKPSWNSLPNNFLGLSHCKAVL